ncbi:hypothetical protein O0I10_009605 [Lichtheimia ornata]|uniref:LIM zinc-binding domain-containing protein n=1 Tax=Lichtheimia ornata TaxID=688661 RepID=A0AAD7UWT3_9FUNG|nr:uncharacterized protein O0I10_009605 [Lichtheimia ornata]KAJ8654715.1 hypothetical protein O0I10_009605 [Lichtheimia ornata]
MSSRVMASSDRISQILPTVKCSDCGEDVQIRKLGEHVCSNMPAVPPLPMLPLRQDKGMNRMAPSSKSPTSSSASGSPLASPKGSQHSYDRNYHPEPVTPPYYGMAPDRRRPSLRDQQQQQQSYRGYGSSSPPPPLREDSLRSDDDPYYRSSPKTPTFKYSDQYPRPYPSNSTSPAPPSSNDRGMGGSPRTAYAPRNDYDYDRGYSPLDKYSNGSSDRLGNGGSAGGGVSGGNGSLDTLMADLMSSLGSDIHDTDRRPSASSRHASDACAACGDEFDYRDDVVNHHNQYYHKTCFNCQMCRATFDRSRPCYEYNGKLYCERDYNVVKKRIVCSGCDRPITSNVNAIKVMGRYYHPGHVKCYHCYEPLDERTGYKEHQGHLYCRSDFKSLFLPMCRACNRPVEREAVSAMDGKLQGKWHLECFGCHICHEEFPDNTFYVFENAPYCKRHYHQLNNSLCRTCDDPIEGPCAQTIEGWRFHPECFRCNVCRCAITDVYYMFERRIYCETHIRQLQRQRNIRAEKRRTQFGRI